MSRALPEAMGPRCPFCFFVENGAEMASLDAYVLGAMGVHDHVSARSCERHREIVADMMRRVMRPREDVK